VPDRAISTARQIGNREGNSPMNTSTTPDAVSRIAEPDTDLTEAYRLFASATDRSEHGANAWPGLANRGIDALAGVGHVLLAIHRQLEDANNTGADISAHLEQLSVTADELVATLENIAPRRTWRAWPRTWRRKPGTYPITTAAPALPAPAATPMSDADVMAALTGLWSASRWQRLDIYRAPAGGYGGYCITARGTEVSTADAVTDPAAYPPGITELTALFTASGWRRFEILGNRARNSCGGWCERPDGSGVHVADYLTEPSGWVQECPLCPIGTPCCHGDAL
jgi:hypothetical protein